MKIDFTIQNNRKLILSLIDNGHIPKGACLTQSHIGNSVLTRQDVDINPERSLGIAILQNSFGIRSSYYFRVGPESFNQDIILRIADLDHEIGYHYEDMNLVEKSMMRRRGAGRTEEKIVRSGIESFEKNLEKFRKIVPVKSICMHGSPISKWDSRLLWKYYDYKAFGIKYEPYFDIPFEDRLYLTDTGRRWNGSSVSVRDRAESGERPSTGSGTENNLYADWKRKPIEGSLMNMTPKAMEFQNKYNFIHTSDIISAIESGNFPEKVMFTFHPQRWTDKPLPWLKELVWQNTKNLGKYFLIKIRK